MERDPFVLRILSAEDDFKSTALFDCGDGDLNEFFQQDALSHKKELLAETYSFHVKTKAIGGDELSPPVAFVSFLNDKIELTKEEKAGNKKGFWKLIKKKVPNKKRYSSYPAVKIGRLGVKKEYSGKGIGTTILNMAKSLFLTENRTGCRFITVDAYNQPPVLDFYQRNGFSKLEDDPDPGHAQNETVTLFFDLKEYCEP